MKTKVVVITGASSGIGAALARQLGSAGHKLVLAARREKELAEVAAQTGGLPVTTDVCRRSDMVRLKDEALMAFGQVDVWVNNAGRGIGRKVLELTDENFDEMFRVNVKSALYGMQAILPHFQERGQGHLINISSYLGRVPLVTFRSAYSAAKAALNVLTANLRMDLAGVYPNIHVSVVMPGMVATEFQKNALGGTPATSPAGGAAKPQSAEEVAAAIANLIENPKPELYTNPASVEMVQRYYQDVDAFEKSLQRGT